MPLLDARLGARSRYDAFLGVVGEWDVPLSIRDAMRAWRFEDATALIDGAEDVLALRGRVERAASAAGLTAPASLQQTFEDDDGFDDAIAEGGAELEAIDRYVAADAERPAAMTPLMTLGMWSKHPDADLVAAREAFARGELAASVAASDAAAATWVSAETVGQGRVFSIATIVIALLFLLALLVVTRRRRRRRHVRMQASRLRTGPG